MVRLCGRREWCVCVLVCFYVKKKMLAQKRANTKRQATIHRAHWMSNSHKTQFVVSRTFTSSRTFHCHPFIYKCTQYSKRHSYLHDFSLSTSFVMHNHYYAMFFFSPLLGYGWINSSTLVCMPLLIAKYDCDHYN